MTLILILDATYANILLISFWKALIWKEHSEVKDHSDKVVEGRTSVFNTFFTFSLVVKHVGCFNLGLVETDKSEKNREKENM